jgi:pimeloyl-ACP methyl ester carboxylesterase
MDGPAGSVSRRLSVPADAPVGTPEVVVVHGFTEDGVEDPRLWRFAAALCEAGFLATAPRIEPMTVLHLGLPDTRSLDAAVGTIAGLLRNGPPRRHGAIGLSVAGALALEAATQEGAAPSALLLVGAPDDLPAVASGWFRVPDAPPNAQDAVAARAEAGRLGRLAVARSALPRLVGGADRDALDRWTHDPPGWRLPTPPAAETLSSEAGRRFAAAVAAGPGISDADRDWLLAAVDDLLAPMSPSRLGATLSSLSCPVFLVHGVGDPLVPVEQMDRLAARLSRHVPVRTLRSTMLSHVGVEEPSLVEKWKHVRFVQAFFDQVAD